LHHGERYAQRKVKKPEELDKALTKDVQEVPTEHRLVIAQLLQEERAKALLSG
jgi:hypothetical protein